MTFWDDEATKIKNRAKHYPLKILVWGPGDPGATAPDEKIREYHKRLQIQKVLLEEFDEAKVNLSEDPEMQSLGTPMMSRLQEEALQARFMDLVLMLDIGRGVDLELDHFVPTYPWFRDKVYVLLPDKYVPPRGFVQEVFNYLTPERVVGYSEDEFKECKVATEKSVDIATTVAIDRILREE